MPTVVDHHLPTETIAGVLAPETLRRTVDETLEPLSFHDHRSKLSWEWPEALSALGDIDRMAEFLYKVDESALEDAFLQWIEHFDMHAVVGTPEP